MQIQIGLENNYEGRTLAWALDFPGCFTYGVDETDAVVKMPQALLSYQAWGAEHSAPGWLPLDDLDMRVKEAFQVYAIDEDYQNAAEGYLVNAWFRRDWKPLSAAEIERGLELLRWTRADLLDIVAPITPEQLDQTYPGERWSIRGILKHVAGAEWWYLTRLNLVGADEVYPKDEMDRLGFVRQRLESALPELAEKELVIGKNGELWSPRKLLRRALWHERDHTHHILKLCLGLKD